MLARVESLVLVNANLHLLGEDADRRGVSRPGSVGEDLSREFNTGVVSQLLALSRLRELLLEFLTHLNVSEHLADFIHGVHTTFHFEFLEHFLLSFLREEGLVEETRSQELGVGLDEDISTVKAAE
jgi:hypothetical protein